MKIELKKLQLSYFKGIRALDLEFGNVTNILGDNATGKTTIFDAFKWLFFGKDSTDRSTFEIKTLDLSGKALPKIEHEVAALIDVDGAEVSLRRVFREKWQTKKGSSTPEFAGNETIYYWNDVPVKEQEYKDKIKGIIDENIFKLITDAFYFNSLPWQSRRNALVSIAGNITTAEVVATNSKFESLLKTLNNKTLEEHKRELSAKKKKIQDEHSFIPTRIDELRRLIPKETPNFSALESVIATLEKDIASVDTLLTNKSAVAKKRQNELLALQQKIYSLESQANQIANSVRSQIVNQSGDDKNKLKALTKEITNLKTSLANSSVTLQNAERKIEEYKKQRDDYRAQWNQVNIQQFSFDEHEATCPVCKQQLPADNIERMKVDMESNFNNGKAKRLASINADGNLAKKMQETYEGQKADLVKQIIETKNSISQKEAESSALNHPASDQPEVPVDSQVNNALFNHAEYQKFCIEIDALKQQQKSLESIDDEDNSNHINRKRELTAQLDEAKKQLTEKDHIEQTDTRIKNLLEQEKQLAQSIADLEKQEFLIEEFTRAKVDMLEQKLNGRFQKVKFKLFETQINGGEKECCDTTIDGVPFSDANNAARINAGLDIINTLCAHYEVYAPVFIDNAESVNTLLPVNSQLIRLVVSQDKKLRIAGVGQLGQLKEMQAV